MFASSRRNELLVLLFACLIYLVSIPSPPSLMDDVDAVQATIARDMLESGDWVTPRLNGVRYLEKPPLKYWMIAACYQLLGVEDWVARLPLALCTVALCWLTYRFAFWAFGDPTALYAGLTLTASVGLWLFTRVQISDAMLTLTITFAMWSLIRTLDEQEPRPRRWAAATGAALGAGLLIKGLIALVIPLGAAAVYLGVSGRIFERTTWRSLRPLSTLLIAFAVAAPWHVLAILRNPPYLHFSLSSEPGTFRGFFWFYFFNEHLFRFLGTRYPKDYNTVPRLAFWLFHLLWLFPWSAFLGGVFALDYKSDNRAARTRRLALCWTGFVLVFFTLSTSQEYYSMPCYPALAMLLAGAFERGGAPVRVGRRVLGTLLAAFAATLATIFWLVRDAPAEGDISRALTANPELYTLSLGHMADLTLGAFAYLRAPGVVTGAALAVGLLALGKLRDRSLAPALAVMMTLFLQASRLALVSFDPYLSSRPLAEALNAAPPGRLIVDNQYYAFSSVFFYADRDALLLNGRVNNLVYGSYAPDAPDVFIDDQQFTDLWGRDERWYLCVEDLMLPRIRRLAGKDRLFTVAAGGGKSLLSNRAFDSQGDP